MQSVRFNCQTFLHLIVQPEEHHPGPLRGCLKSPDSRQILSSMCSLQLPESWHEACTTFCELGIGRTFQTSSKRRFGPAQQSKSRRALEAQKCRAFFSLFWGMLQPEKSSPDAEKVEGRNRICPTRGFRKRIKIRRRFSQQRSRERADRCPELEL